MKWHWQVIDIYDADGCSPEKETRIEKLREYRDHGCMDGYFFEDPNQDVEIGLSENVYDSYHHQIRPIHEAGPTPDEIDWSDFPNE